MSDTRRCAAALFAAVLSCAFIAQLAAAASQPAAQPGAIPYATGGVSEEGRDNLRAIARDFNVKLVLATTSGAYLSDGPLRPPEMRSRAAGC